MATWQRVLAYAAVVAVVVAVAVGIGQLVGPLDTGSDDEHGHDDDRIHVEPVGGEEGHGHADDAGGHSDSGHGAGAYELALEREVLESGRPEVAFQVLDETGEPVTAYDVEHEKRLHLIAVRRDLAVFRHVHPRLDAATGRWSVPIELGAGSWRLYADFVPAGGEPTVAEAELMVGGRFSPQELGPDTTTSRVAGYQVHLERDDATSTVTLHVTRDGAEVTDLEPYLGAYGHLVAIRADDLAYLHVHPEEGGPGPELAFHAELDRGGRYRLFLDFRHGGRVHTADFTVTVGTPGDDAGDSDDPGDDEHGEHAEDDGGHGH